MTRLRDALRKKFATPQEAMKALGLDESLIDPKEQRQMKVARLSRIAAVAKGALMAHLTPIMAADAKINLDAVFKDVTAKNFKERRPDLLKTISSIASGKLAKDAKMDMDAMEKAMDVAEKEKEAEDAEEKEAEEKKAKDAIPDTGKSALDKGGKDAEGGGFKKFLKEKMSEDDYKAACDMMEAEDAEESEEEKKKKAGDRARDAKPAKDKKAKDAEPEEKVEKEEGEEKVTKGAMDAALKAERASTRETVAKEIRETERGIRVALAEVEPFVGKLKPELALDSKVDVYRNAAIMLDIPDAKTMHAEALWPVIQATAERNAAKAMPKQSHVEQNLGFDSSSVSDAVKRVPALARIKSV